MKKDKTHFDFMAKEILKKLNPKPKRKRKKTLKSLTQKEFEAEFMKVLESKESREFLGGLGKK